MKRIIWFLAIPAVLLNACKDPWEERFNGDILTTRTVWEILDSNGDYGDFVLLLQQTGLDTVLQRNTVFSVYVPERNSLAALADLSPEEIKPILSFHVANSIIYSSDVLESVPVKTIGGKQIFLERKDGEIVLNQDTRLLKGDIRAVNGVVNEIEKVLEIRPNIAEIIENEETFSYIAGFLEEGTEVFFDEQNSLPIGIDSIGRTIYDSLWVTTNDFFSENADIGSEDGSFTIFLAEDILLDTSRNGIYKEGYLATLPRFIIEGIYTEDDLPGELISVSGQKLSLTPGIYGFYRYASNGIAYKLASLEGINIPLSVTWEFTDVSDFDSIRGSRTTDYLPYYDQLQEIRVMEIDGGFSEFAYEIKSGALNRDYLKIGTESGTDADIEFDLPEIIASKYRLTINAVIRAADGALFDAYLNDKLVTAGVNLNGGIYQFEKIELGTVELKEATGNVFRIEIDGSSALKTKCYIDYLLFEPIN